jgi:hypothetical protein
MMLWFQPHLSHENAALLCCRTHRTRILVAANRDEETIPPYTLEHDVGVGHMSGVIAKEDRPARCGRFPWTVFRRQVLAARMLREAKYVRVKARIEDEDVHPEAVALPPARCTLFYPHNMIYCQNF